MQPRMAGSPVEDEEFDLQEWVAMELFARWMGSDRDWFSEEPTKKVRFRKAAEKAFEVAGYFVEELAAQRKQG